MQKVYTEYENRKIRTAIWKLYGGILLAGILYIIWIKSTGLMIPCFYLTTSGYLCPGCGTTRMLLSMMRFDFASAFAYNPVTFCLFFVWNGIALLCYWGKWKFIMKKGVLFGCFYASLSVMGVFWILRNII